jgi:hypothetical protein
MSDIQQSRSPPVKIQIQKPLFAWDCLEDHPILATIKQLLETIPDGKLIEGLEAARGKGRNDYPLRTLWGVVLLTIALRHTGFEACLGELRRNPTLAKLVGIDSADEIPKGWNLSRFLDVLGQEPHRLELEAIFNRMIQRLGEVVPDLGRDTAGDSTSLKARLRRCDRPKTTEEEGKPAEPAPTGSAGNKPEKVELDRCGLPQPTLGRKEYKDEKGNITKVVAWFGYKLHLLVDAKHEVALVWRVSSTKAGDNELLPALVDQAKANLPRGRMRTLAYDKAADTVDAHEKLHACGIKPVIQNRALWKEEQEKLLPGHDGNVTGATRFYAMVGAVMLVHAAFATLLAAAPRREGTLGKMRLSPIAKVLHERIAANEGQTNSRGARPKARWVGVAKQRRLFAA